MAGRNSGRIAGAAALGLFCAACGGPGIRNDEHSIYRPAELGADRFALVGGFNVHYVEAGEGSPIVLIPGAFSTWRVWSRVLPSLARAHRVIALDYVGTGDSDKPADGFGYGVGEQADLVVELVESLGLVKPLLVGVSYGSAIALNVAARHADLPSGVVCIEGGAVIDPQLLNYSRMSEVLGIPVAGPMTLWIMRSGILDATIAKAVMGDAWPQLTPTEQEEIEEIQSSYLQTASPPAMYGVYRSITGSIDFTAEMGNARAPIVYLYGEQSRYREIAEANVAFFQSHHCNARIVRFKQGIHDLELQFPGAIAEIVAGCSDRGIEPTLFASGTPHEVAGADVETRLVQ